MHTDIRLDLISRLPEPVKPYALLARLDRPVGWILLLLPGWWAIAAAMPVAHSLTNPSFYFLLLLFLIGAPVMRAAGCIVNDLWDRDYDRAVIRTQGRPLASGTINTRQAFIFLAALLTVGLIVLMQLPLTAILCGILSLPLIIVYPLMKRITWWPQAFLGITFNFGVLIGWAAATGTLSFAALLLYMAAFFWTIGYDTVYAHQDKEDDALIGVKSTARLFQDKSPRLVALCYVLCLLCLVLSGGASGQPVWFYPLLSLPAAHLFWQLKSWEPGNPASSLQIFKKNSFTGLLIFIVLLVS